MAIGGLSAANGVAKIAGEGYFTIYQNTAELANRFEKGRGKPIGARGYELATEEDGVYTYGLPGEGGNVPAGNSVQTIRPTVYSRRYMHAVQLTGASMDELAANHESEMYTENWTDLNLKGAVEASHKNLNILLTGTGNSRIGTVSTGASSTTQTFTGSGAGYDWTRYMRKNQSIQFVDPATGIPRNTTGVTITNSIGPFATTITVSSSVSTTTGDYVVINGGWNGAPSGLQHIIDDGTLSSPYFQNINRTDHPKYSANMLSAGNNSVTLSILRRILGAKIFQSVGSLRRQDFEIWSSEAQWSVIASLGWTLKRYEGKSKSLDLGFTAIEWEGIPWVTEVDFPMTQIDFINWKTMWMFTNTEWGWDEKTGSIWKQVPSSTSGFNFTDRYEGHYRWIGQTGCPDPRQNASIYSCAVPANYYF